MAVSPPAFNLFKSTELAPPEGEGEKFNLVALDERLGGLDPSVGCLTQRYVERQDITWSRPETELLHAQWRVDNEGF